MIKSFAYRINAVLIVLMLIAFSSLSAFSQSSNSSGPAQGLKIDLQKLNGSLGTTYSTLDLGQPIPLRPSSYYLITVGNWEIERRRGQVQGEVFRTSVPFWPDPSRMEHIFITGEFQQLILFEATSGSYTSLLKNGESVNLIQLLNPSLTPSRDPLFICVNKRTDDDAFKQMRLVSTLRNNSINLFNEDKVILDWAVNAGTGELIVLTESSDTKLQTGNTSSQAEVNKIKLETILTQ